MKKFYITLVLSLLVAVFGAQAASAFDTFSVGFQVQNLSSNAATIQITYYNQDGSVADTVSDTVPANDSNNYATLPVAAGFDGSVVISSNEPVAAIVNVNASASSVSYGASYSSISTGSESVSLPIINHDFFNINTQVSVQNAGSAAANVTIAYAGQASCNETATIPVGAVHRFKQATNTCLPDGYNGAATVTAGSGQSIVATVLQETPNSLLAYNGFTSGSTAPAMPLITQNLFGIASGIQLQNLGTTDTTVTVSYSPADTGTACTETALIPAGAAVNFALDAFIADIQTNTTSTCSLGAPFNGTAAVTTNSANQPLAGIVNQTIQSAGQASAYSAFDPASASSTVVMPLTMNKFGIWTGYNVMNVGTSSDTITCSFAAIDGTAPANKSGTAAAGGGISLNNFSDAEFIGSATCTSTGQSIVAVVNQAVTGAAGDGTYTYEAFGK